VSGKSRQVKKATRTVQLYVGGDWDLVEQYNRLDQEAAKTLAGKDRTRLDELAARIAEDTMSFRFEALVRRATASCVTRAWGSTRTPPPPSWSAAA
jgi:hypothetical protein